MNLEKYKKNGLFIIAEAGVCHLGDLEKGYEMIEKAANCGVSAVKFQHVLADEIVLPSVGEIEFTARRVNLYQKFKQMEVSFHFLNKLKDYCEKKNVLFLCSSFGPKSTQDLTKMNVEAYKIASPELNYYPLWRQILSTKKPIFFSTGVSKQVDIDHLMRRLLAKKPLNQLVLFHCITRYPALEKESNLLVLQTLKHRYHLSTGISDHTQDPYFIPLLSCALKQSFKQTLYLEKHFTLDKNSAGLDDIISVDPNELKELCLRLKQIVDYFKEKKPLKNLNKETILPHMTKVLPYQESRIKEALGNGLKKLANCEKSNYLTSNRSLFSIKNLSKGETLSWDKVAYFRSEKNLLPGLSHYYDAFVSKMKTKQAIECKQAIRLDNVSFF